MFSCSQSVCDPVCEAEDNVGARKKDPGSTVRIHTVNLPWFLLLCKFKQVSSNCSPPSYKMSTNNDFPVVLCTSRHNFLPPPQKKIVLNYPHHPPPSSRHLLAQ